MITSKRWIPLAVALAASPAYAGKTDVNATMRNAINANANAKAAVLRTIGISDPQNWTITSLKVKKIKPVNMALQMPPYKLEYITSTEILNCGETGTSRTVTLAKEVTNSTTVTKSETLEVGAEVTVSAEYMGISASATASTSYSMTNETQQANSKTERVEDSTTVSFDKEGGRISVLQANVLTANSIPWTATFVPEDNDPIDITATAHAAGKVCIYEHTGYGGKSKCWNAPTEVSNVGKEWNDEMTGFKLEGPVTLTIYEHTGFGGSSKSYTSSVSNVGKDWNDKMTGFKLAMNTKSGSPTFGSFKNALPQNAREFKATGSISVSSTKVDGKRITNYVMPDKDVKAGCANVPGYTVAAATMAAPAAKAVAPGPGQPAAAASAVKAPMPVSGASRVVQRELSKDEAMKKIAAAKPL